VSALAHPLDDPVRSALEGADARFAEISDGARRYGPEFSVFSSGSWDGIATLVGPGGRAVLAGPTSATPGGWTEELRIPGFQMTGEDFAAREDDEVVPLGAGHAAAMAELVVRTQPGPWAPRTWELGGYRGILVDGALVAMAGERMHADGFTEISAVCTDPAHRGRGLATRVMRAVAAGVVARGEVPFLHVAGANAGAVALYERLGFRTRRPIEFVVVVAPTLEP
jgi:ribosomal protein S18 acetylase RimI-like enzyme